MGSDDADNDRRTGALSKYAISRDFSILLLGLAVVGLGFGILTPIIPRFAEDNLGMSVSEIGAAYMVFAVSFAVAMLPSGYLADRLGRRLTIFTGMFMFGVTTLALVWITEAYQFYILRAAEGIGAAMVTPAAFALTIDLVPETKRGVAMGAEGTAQLVGAFGGPGLGGILASQFGFYYPFYVSAGLAFLCTALILLIREPSSSKAVDKPSLVSMFAAWSRNAKENKALTALTTRGFVMGIVQGLFNLGLILYWYERLDMSEAEVGLAISLGLLVMMTGTLPFGTLSDRHGRRPFLLMGGAIMAVGLSLNVFASEVWQIFLIVALTDFGAAMSNPAVGATLGDVMAPKERGRVMAAYQMVQAGGNIVGFLGIGLMYDYISPEAPIIACSLAMAFATLIIAVYVKETVRRIVPVDEPQTG